MLVVIKSRGRIRNSSEVSSQLRQMPSEDFRHQMVCFGDSVPNYPRVVQFGKLGETEVEKE